MDGKRKLIYAEDFISSLRDDPLINGANFKRVVQHINDATAVEAVVHGRWVEKVDMVESYLSDCTEVFYECSVCESANIGESPYCPNCGAKMED